MKVSPVLHHEAYPPLCEYLDMARFGIKTVPALDK
jgi:hypothetical protein